MQLKRVKRVVDILLGIGLMLLMSYQLWGEEKHEWTGIAMTALMILHQILNRKWYAALFRGRYTPLRIVQTFVNAALVSCFILTSLSGISMSVYAVPFFSEFMRASLARRLHLTLSHWSFVLMGLHLGLHIPAMLGKVKRMQLRRIGLCASVPAAGAGLWLFLRNNFPDYLFCRVPFAFYDYDKAAFLVLLEALLIAFFWVFVGSQLPGILNRKAKERSKLVALLAVLTAVAIGAGLTCLLPVETDRGWGGGTASRALSAEHRRCVQLCSDRSTEAHREQLISDLPLRQFSVLLFCYSEKSDFPKHSAARKDYT